MIEREWNPGDRIDLELTMPVRRVRANTAVKDDAGCVALERGPLVYCVEGVDNGGDLALLQIDDSATLDAVPLPDLLGGTTVLRGEAASNGKRVRFQAVPYHLWNNRGDGPMRVWLREGSSEIAEQLP